jgi:AMMECR1 domain-containing protein
MNEFYVVAASSEKMTYPAAAAAAAAEPFEDVSAAELVALVVVYELVENTHYSDSHEKGREKSCNSDLDLIEGYNPEDKTALK